MMVIGLIKIEDFLSMAYRGEEKVIDFSNVVLALSGGFYLFIVLFTQEFYISNLGIKIKKGILGKLYSIDFKSIKLAILYKGGKSISYSGLKVVCSNGKIVTTGNNYSDSSIQEAVQLLEQKNIKVFTDAKEAFEAADAVMNDNSVVVCDSDSQYRHYLIACLPLILSLILYLGVTVNKNCGNQKDIAIDTTILSKKIDNGKSGKTDKILVVINGHEEWFPVKHDFYMKSYSGERLKMYYKKGSLQIDYNVQFLPADDGNEYKQMNL